MTFFTVVTRGLMRRPVRTGLTIVGIAIGIARWSRWSESRAVLNKLDDRHESAAPTSGQQMGKG